MEKTQNVNGASYIGRPIDNTAMFITKKVEHLIHNLSGVSGCLVFAQTGVCVPDAILQKNTFVFSDMPQRDYARYVSNLADERHAKNKMRKMTLTEGGYYVGENVTIGENAYIEPGCLIGHDVTIGKNARIFAGTVIKNAIIGDDFIANEYAAVGTFGFTMADDEQGNKIRIPTLGRVIIGNYVEVGAHDNISCGSAGDTVLEDCVKLDAFVHIGHDAILRKNVEITANVVVGGFVEMGEKAYAGISAVIRNRVNIGSNAIIGMGATVTKSVDPDITVVGNPAKPFIKKV